MTSAMGEPHTVVIGQSITGSRVPQTVVLAFAGQIRAGEHVTCDSSINQERVLITAVSPSGLQLTGTFTKSHTAGRNCFQYSGGRALDLSGTLFYDAGIVMGNLYQQRQAYSPSAVAIAIRGTDRALHYPFYMNWDNLVHFSTPGPGNGYQWEDHNRQSLATLDERGLFGFMRVDLSYREIAFASYCSLRVKRRRSRTLGPAHGRGPPAAR